MKPNIDKTLLDRFSKVYNQRLWGNEGSISGPGSRCDNPMVERAVSALDFVIVNYGIRSIADIPCGDFAFLSVVTDRYPEVSYAGFDIVPALIEDNRKKHSELRFEQFDIVSDVPERFDLIFTKELLIHLPNEQIYIALNNMKRSGSTYLLASNSFGVENLELVHNALGYARPVDLLAPPFSLPKPLWRNEFYFLWTLSDCDF
jgi:hypothetical protein